MARHHSTALLLATGLAVVLCGCASEPRHVGRLPLGDRRPLSERPKDEAVQGPRSQASREASPDARIERGSRTPQHVAVDATVIGIYATKIYHRPRCEVIADRPAVDRVTFVSPYDGMDARYGPCRVCKPGP